MLNAELFSRKEICTVRAHDSQLYEMGHCRRHDTITSVPHGVPIQGSSYIHQLLVHTFASTRQLVSEEARAPVPITTSLRWPHIICRCSVIHRDQSACD